MENLAAKAVNDPSILAGMSETDLRRVLATLVKVAYEAHERWMARLEANRKPTENGDRLLSLKEVAKRMRCSAQTVVRGVKTGQYPFMFKNGQQWVASENGLERWIAARVKRHLVANLP